MNGGKRSLGGSKVRRKSKNDQHQEEEVKSDIRYATKGYVCTCFAIWLVIAVLPSALYRCYDYVEPSLDESSGCLRASLPLNLTVASHQFRFDE